MSYARQVELVDLSNTRPLRTGGADRSTYTPCETLSSNPSPSSSSSSLSNFAHDSSALSTRSFPMGAGSGPRRPVARASVTQSISLPSSLSGKARSVPSPTAPSSSASAARFSPASIPTAQLPEISSLLHASLSAPAPEVGLEQREDMFRQCLNMSCVDVDELRRIVWAHGIPDRSNSMTTNSWVRSLTWKLLTGYLPPERSEWASVLAANRARYWTAVHDATVDPSSRPVDGDHPLNDSDNSQWREFFRDADVRALIARDAERTHADLPHIHQRIRQPLERLLFVYAKTHPNPGYRQGMNELAAPFLVVFAQEVKAKFNNSGGGSAPDDVSALNSSGVGVGVGVGGGGGEQVDESDIEADAYYCFCAIMKEMINCYVQDSPNSNSNLNNNGNGSSTQLGIGRQLRELQALLRIKDPELEGRLDSLGIDPRFYGLRWIRLWLSQEFYLPDCLALWDSFLTAEVRLPWIRYVCVAMLIRVRDNILDADFTKSMKLLLNYPPCDIAHLLRIADRLRTSNAVIVRTARP